MDIVIKREPEENRSTSVSDVDQLLAANNIKEEENGQDYSWSEQLTSTDPDLVIDGMKSEPRYGPYCMDRSVHSMPFKEETALDIPFDDNQRTDFELQEDVEGCTTVTSSRTWSPKQNRHKIKSNLKWNTWFPCNFCDYITKRSGHIRHHMITIHPKEEPDQTAFEKEKPYRCPHCNYSATLSLTLKIHIMSVHKKKKSYKCSHCSYKATKSGHLKVHIMSVHKKEKPHQCPHCDYCATLFSNLKIHIMSVHEKGKPYQCPLCDYSAAQSSNLKTHIMYVHKKEKPHQCSHCDYSTTRSNTLKNHIMSVHKKEKPHQCPYCNYSATQSSTLKTHIMYVHKKERFHQCPHCDYSAALFSDLKTHIMSIHKKEKAFRIVTIVQLSLEP